jgi:hypothetical protein
VANEVFDAFADLSETEDGQELVRAVQKGHETDPAVHLAALAAVLAARPRSEPI